MGLPILGPLIDIVNKVIDRAIPDPVQKAALQIELAKLADQAEAREHLEMMGQIGTNTEEAKSQSMFVAGWRPYVGWTGGIGISYAFVIEPMASWIARVIFHYGGSFPVLDSSQLMALVTGMLGFGGLRTYEKIKGVPDSAPSVAKDQPSVVVSAAKKKILGMSWPF